MTPARCDGCGRPDDRLAELLAPTPDGRLWCPACLMRLAQIPPQRADKAR